MRCPLSNRELETNLGGLKTGNITWLAFKAFSAAPRNLLSNGSEGFKLTSFEKLSGNSKAFGAKWLRTFNI
jgi:hypothetical protein